MIRRSSRALPVLLLLLTGCASLGRFGTARSVPPGDTDVWVALGYVHNRNVAERGVGTGNLPIEVGARHGVTEHLDLGLQTFLGLGGLLDAKYSLLGPENPLALAGTLGLGASAVMGSGESVLHVPVVLQASYRIGTRVTPYAGVGYGAFWIFSDEKLEAPTTGSGTTFKEAARAGHGDGLLLLSVGVEVKLASKVRLLAQYGFVRELVSDRGDKFTFVPSQSFLLGAQFGG